MKTSNKLLLTFALALICSSFISMLIARQNMMITKTKLIEGNSVIAEEKIEASFEEHAISMDGWKEYYINESDQGVLIRAEENLISEFEVLTAGDELEVEFNQGNVSWTIRPEIVFGVSDKDSLILRAEDAAKINGKGPLKLSYLKIESDDHTKIDLDIEVDVLVIDMRDNSSVELSGSAKDVMISIGDHANFDAAGMVCDITDINMRDNARVEILKTKEINGYMRDHTLIVVKESNEIENKSIKTTDNARIDYQVQ